MRRLAFQFYFHRKSHHLPVGSLNGKVEVKYLLYRFGTGQVIQQNGNAAVLGLRIGFAANRRRCFVQRIFRSLLIPLSIL